MALLGATAVTVRGAPSIGKSIVVYFEVILITFMAGRNSLF